MSDLMFLKTEDGIALIAAILMIVVFGFIGVAVVSLVGTQGSSAMNEVKSDQAFFIAAGGMQMARYRFETGTPCAGLTNAVPTALGAGSFTTIGTFYNPVSTLVDQPGGISSSTATIPVDSIAGYAPHGRIRIDAESIDYAGTSTDPLVCGAPACFTGAERGAAGTVAAAHANNAPVTQNQCLVRSIGTVGGPFGNSQRVIEVGLVNNGPTVQTGENTISGHPSDTVTLDIPLPTPVDPARAFLLFNTRHNHNEPTGAMLRGQILDANTLRFQQRTNASRPITIRWYVVEYPSGVNVQRGAVNQVDSIPGGQVQTNVTLPTPVASLNQAFVTWSKTPDPDHVTWDDNDPILGELINTTTLQFRATAPADATHTIWWQVIEFTNPADIFVQKGTIGPTAMNQGGPTTQTVTATLPIAVDVSKTFVLVGYRTSGGSDDDVGARMLRAQLTGPTTITIDRATRRNSRIEEITWQAIELRDGSTVQHGSEIFPNSDPQEIVNLATPVDMTRSVSFASVQPAAGQSMGRSPYAPNNNSDSDYVGVGSVTMALSPAGDQITMDRSNTNSSADIGWFVVEFGSGGGGQPRIDWIERFQ
ncbi:MAG: hypothetical protein MPW16_07870 [Candidatus Manganitrophus sp.]|nr:MAG: hypothetical protein MPW16_07870 [Candidatus Manganitrophus sp.]